MIRFTAPAVLGLALLLTAAALAATNTYSVSGSVSPSQSGTPDRARPVAVRFDYTTAEADGDRPLPVKRYTLVTAGLRTNGRYFPKCSARRMKRARSDRRCPRGSAVGRGRVSTVAGSRRRPGDTSIRCELDLTIYNSGRNKVALWLRGAPNRRRRCPIQIRTAIPGRYVPGPEGAALSFTVPRELLHPTPSLVSAVTKVTSQVRRITRRRRGRTIGYLETVGGCTDGQRMMKVTFVTEDGQSADAEHATPCS